MQCFYGGHLTPFFSFKWFTIIFEIDRFLRARKFDIIKAKEMLIDCEKWRVEFEVEDIVK